MSRRVALGLVGAVLLGVGGFGVGARPAGWTAPGPLGGAVGLVLCALGIAVLTVAWWALRDSDARTLLRAAGLWSLPLLLTPPLATRDVYAYAGQAQLVVAGLDPYAAGPAAVPGPLADGVDDVWSDTPSPYGPAFLGAAALVVRLTGERVVPAVLGMRLLAVLGVLLLAWALPRLARAHGVPPGRAVWLGVASPLLLVHGVAGAHNDVLMAGLLVAGLAVVATTGVPGRLVLGAALITLAALVKVPAAAGLVVLPLLVRDDWPGRLRAAPAVAVAAAVTAVLTTLASGVGWGWVTALDAGRARLSLFSPVTGVGALVEAATGLEAMDAVLLAGLLLGALAAATCLLLSPRLGAVQAVGLALLAVVVLGPVVLPWYLLWSTSVLAAVADRRTALRLGAASAVLVLLVLPSGRSVVRPPLYGLPLLLAGAAALVVPRVTERQAGPRAPASNPSA